MTKPERLAAFKPFIDAVRSGLPAVAAYEASGYDVPCSEKACRRAASIVKGTPHKDALSAAQPKPEKFATTITEKEDGTATAETSPIRLLSRSRITTVDELLDATKVDRDRFNVTNTQVKTYETKAATDDEPHTMFAIRATLTPKKLAERHDLIREELRGMIARGAPRLRAIRRTKPTDPHLFELSMADLHVGKYAWAEETGEDYDSDIASDRFRDALESLTVRASAFGIERVLYVVGNDLLQADNERDETTRGTRVDVDTRYKRVFRRACELQIEAVTRLREFAPVDVVVVPGNHDQLAAFHVGEFLSAWFDKAPDITIDNTAPLRKYYRYGTNLLGLTHGNEEKPTDLARIMADERRWDWAETTSREWHCGHLHKRKVTHYVSTDTHGGVVVRILPSLSGTDRWHHVKGYVGNAKACEGYLHHREDGYAGHLSFNVQKSREVA